MYFYKHNFNIKIIEKNKCIRLYHNIITIKLKLSLYRIKAILRSKPIQLIYFIMSLTFLPKFILLNNNIKNLSQEI